MKIIFGGSVYGEGAYEGGRVYWVDQNGLLCIEKGVDESQVDTTHAWGEKLSRDNGVLLDEQSTCS